ncbi:hypothetical protein [Megasphaera sp.]|uniref:hypothetical protein n=1 Tax=Megasphaera sp. TaxID=2023260 RepID=UPI00257EAF22|nr:hypothetical protein [Megasphaera sp.]
MAKLTKFTLSPSGDLVYKSNGKLAPSSYTFRKNTVYGANGRRVGSLSRNLTRTEATKIAKAEANRNKRKAAAKRKAAGMAKPSQKRPRSPSGAKPREGTKVTAGIDEAEEFEGTEFPGADKLVIAEFARRVKAAALSVAPEALQQKILALSDEAIYEGYKQDAYIFEVFFLYHGESDEPHKSDVSVWLYQFVKRIETYMGVSS